jgi:hypothetical protein
MSVTCDTITSKSADYEDLKPSQGPLLSASDVEPTVSFTIQETKAMPDPT